jgi:hypothetical protein
VNKSTSRYRYARSLWSEAIRRLCNGKCFLCGKQETAERPHAAHHIIPARNRWLELYILNGVPLCSLPDGRARLCHGWVHDTVEGRDELTDKLATFPGWLEALEAKRKEPHGSFSKSDLEAAIDELKEHIETTGREKQ